MSEPLWIPSPERVEGARLTDFVRRLESRGHGPFADYPSLHRWSVDSMDLFWREVLDFTSISYGGDPTCVRVGAELPGARWFPDLELNYAENLLRGEDERIALIFECERDDLSRRISFAELRSLVARARAGLERLGVRAGDRVAAWLPNIPETVIAALATASLGAIWSSCSPDFGTQGVVDRFAQIEPKVFLAADGYLYGGKSFGLEARLEEIVARLPSLEHVVVIPHNGPPIRAKSLRTCWSDFLGPAGSPLTFDRFPFDHPLWILFTSGTTGAPKCIVHGHGGVLLKHAEEHALQCDIGRRDVLFYFTTCGWMMWNWLISGLAQGATIVLYDGNPLAPSQMRLFELVERHRMTVFGTSPRYLSALARSGRRPDDQHDLSSLRTLLSTGSPLHPAQFEWVYAAISKDLHLASISGGTDLVGCFVSGAPNLPVHAGEIQAKTLGMDVASVDDGGREVVGERGELVCRAPFPSVPIGFWNDPDGAKFRSAYFERFEGVWHHGDFIEFTERGSAVIHGRSDATLNPGGIRIGTAEIYRQIEGIEEISDSLAVARRTEDDVHIVLFVVLAGSAELSGALEEKLRDRIRVGASPRHVPAEIHAVREIPRTISGKAVEIAVSRILEGAEVAQREALANPEALDEFRAFATRDDPVGE